MDREIPKEIRQKERNKKIIRYSSIGVASIVVIGVLISVLRAGVEAKDLVFSTVDTGVIEVSVSASGKVVPAFEEIINSPTDIVGSCLTPVTPPGIALKTRMESPKGIYKTCFEQFRNTFTFFISKSSTVMVSIWPRDIDLFVCCVEISAGHHWFHSL